MIKKRRERNQAILDERDKKVVEDYNLRDSGGGSIYSIEEVAKRNNISIPMIYKIINKHNNKKDKY